MNTFDLKFINLEQSARQFRANTTCDQLFSTPPLVYYPCFKVVLSSDGKDWALVLENLSALQKTPFYSDAVDRPVDFFVTFDFAYSNLSPDLKSSFIANANLVLPSERPLLME